MQADVQPAQVIDTAGGGGLVPVPVSAMVCVVGLALSVIVNVSVWAPVEVGLNTRPKVQCCVGASESRQVFDTTVN